MAAGEPVKVSVVTERTPNVINCTKDSTAEELCIILCKKYGIPPLMRSLFALRIRGKQYYLKDNCKVLTSTKDYELRIRYKVPRWSVFDRDQTTYNYYFQQARNDVYENKIPEIKYPDHKKELLGLGIADMARAYLEEGLPMKDVIQNYKKYIPKVIVKKHGMYSKKHSEQYLPEVNKMNNPNRLKLLYLKQVYTLAPNYLAEEYDNVTWQNGEDHTPVRVVVAPFHHQYPGIRVFDIVKQDWFHVCTIEELIYLTRNGESSDHTLEVSRKGTPLFFKFKSEEQLSSFISLCDGYYRLMVKWTFNLSKDDETPSLKELQRMKCHGPVGGAFSYGKLGEKRAKKHGSYILRQCDLHYNIYYLDVCTQNNVPETYKIEFKGSCYEFNKAEYYSIDRIVAEHQDSEGKIFLNECIPPSEYDKSQLLLCGEPQKLGVHVDQAELQEILKDNKSPRCLPIKDIELFRSPHTFGADNITATYKAHWRLADTKKLVVAFKTLQRDKTNDYLRDFIELASKWSCIQSSSIVRLYGVTLSSPTALVLEYLAYGPFNVYLKENKDKIQPILLKKVAASLARALWDLSEAGVVHGYIRCKKLLVAACDSDRVVVKLSGPTLRQLSPDDVHWLPVEFFVDMAMAKRSVVGDIWAFATTLWEVFSFGQSPTETNPVMTARSYKMGDRLLKPAKCPQEVWEIMRQCWQIDPLRPQEIMRDMNHMLHREYVPSHHEYVEPMISFDYDQGGTVSNERFIASELGGDDDSNRSLISENSSVTSLNGTMTTEYNSDNGSANSLDNINPLNVIRQFTSRNSLACGMRGADDPEDLMSRNGPLRMESILVQGKTHLVTLLKRIGSGNYGQVFKGWMEADNQEFHGMDVAVKKLTQQESDDNINLYQDSKNELEIMKSLSHENIVEILGYWLDGHELVIVMEYMEQGSLNYYLKFEGDKLRLSHLIKYAKDIASGMDHMSAKNIVHRDLAARNILVVNEHHVKITDFGLARMLNKDESEYRLKSDRLLPIKWYAPESAVKPFHFSTKSDVWSYGVTAWEIFTRGRVDVPLFDVERATERASCFQIPEGCPSEIYRHLMRSCWELDPEARPPFIELVRKCKRFLQEYK